MEKYYKKRENQNVKASDYEEEYWGIITDPDGNVRNRALEKDKFLASVKSEVDFVNSLPPSKVFDLGCGLGFMLQGIDSKHQKFGLELSKFAADYASQFATVYNKPIEDADIPENSFDVIISHHVIEHIQKPEIFIEKIKHILRPNGILIISTPDFESVCAKLFKENYRMLSDKTHVSLFSFSSLKSMLKDYKFDIFNVDFPYFDTEYFTEKNVLKLLDYNSGDISPACWGNFITIYCKNIK